MPTVDHIIQALAGPSESRCPASRDGRHLIDPRSFRSDFGSADIVDIACGLCGLSGSVPILYEDVRWDEE